MLFLRWTNRPQSNPKDARRPRGLLARGLRAPLKWASLATCALLAFSAVAQSLVIILVGLHQEIPVPAPLARKLFSGFESMGLRVRCESLRFDLTGGIRAGGVRISDLQDRHMGSVGQLYAHVDPALIVGGVLMPDRVLVDNAAIILPAYLSDTGADTEVVGSIDASVSLFGAHAVVGAFQAKAGPVPASLSAPLSVAFNALKGGAPAAGPSAAGDGTDRNVSIQRALRSLGRATSFFTCLQGPSLAVRPLGDGTFDILLYAQSVDYDDFVAASPVLHAVGNPATLLSADFSASNVSYRGCEADGVFVRLTAPVPLSGGPLTAIPLDAVMEAGRLRFRGEAAEGVHLSASRSAGRTVARVTMLLDGLPATLSARVGDDGNVSAEGELFTLPGIWLRLASIPEENLNRRFFAREPYRVEFSADVPEGVTGWTARFRLHGWDMDGRGMPVDWAIVSGFVNAESLFCDDVQLYTRGSWAKGTFRQDLSNLDWRMDLRGHIYPPEIGPALGRWWNPLWNEFTFDGPRVDADLTISGNWHDRHYANIKGSVAMHHLLYNGVRINEGRLNLYTGNGFVSLRDLHAESDSGNLDGEISWILKPDDLFDVALRLKSGMPVADLDKAFGSTMSSEVKEWTLATPPSVSLLGNISRLGPAQWTRTIYADAGAGAGSWRSIPFHSLRAQIWSGGGSTVIRVPEAVLLGGTMRADIVISGTGGDSRISMKIALSETEFTPTLAALQSLGGSKGDSQLQDRAGLARLDLVGSALIRDIPGTLDASGSFLVHDAELGKIKVFGALSTLLSGVGLNYGTFSLDAVRGSFRIGGGVAQLRDTQITGPAIRVDAKGSVKLADSGLDFDVKVFLLSNDKPSVMNLIGVILSPFGYILELSLKGSFDDPAWRFKLDPRNIFDRGGDTGATQTPKAAETPAASPAAAR